MSSLKEKHKTRDVTDKREYIDRRIFFPVHMEEIELRNRIVARVKVLWMHFTAEEATWERESEMLEKYPYLFSK